MAATLVTLMGSAPAESAVAYPAPDRFPAATAATLDHRYGATESAVRDALAVARDAGDRRRGGTLDRLLDRQLLEFDPRGNGRAVEVVGDLVRADRIVIVVPGSHTTLDTFDRNRGPGGGARALAEEIAAVDPGARVATVAWLGYDTPQGMSARTITDGLASDGADALRATVATLQAVNPVATISLLCHSYGSVVCAYAAPDLPIEELAVYGSPGVGAASAADFAPARVWAGRAANDWIRHVPFVRVAGIGFGTDPVSPEFDARVFDAGDGGHGDYHLRGSESLHNLARIALGRLDLGDQ
jgi:Alpha/beta hydrolase